MAQLPAKGELGTPEATVPMVATEALFPLKVPTLATLVPCCQSNDGREMEVAVTRSNSLGRHYKGCTQ